MFARGTCTHVHKRTCSCHLLWRSPAWAKGQTTSWEMVLLTAAPCQCHCTAKKPGYSWGKGTDYQLGDGVAEDSALPVPVYSEEVWLQLVAGDKVTCGVTVKGTMFCWGSGSTDLGATGLLGLGSSVTVAETPTQVSEALDLGEGPLVHE
eukprot:scaffold15619_cov23-Tisochrysis_lutea.AAC.1